MRRNRVVLQDNEQAEIIDKARAKRSRKATQNGKEPAVPVAGAPGAETGGVTETIRDMTQGAVAKVGELVKTAAEKIKEMVEATPTAPVSAKERLARAVTRKKRTPPP